MSTSGLPFDDIRALMAHLPPLDAEAAAAIRARDAQLTKPPGSLGRLEEIAVWLGAVQAKAIPTASRPLVAVFAANHGVVAQGVSPYPASVTAAMVSNFAAGGAAINQICGHLGLGLKVFELALEIPTADITLEPALDEAACAATIAFGMEAIHGTDLLCAGRDGHRQHHGGGGDLRRALRRRGPPLGRAAAPASTTPATPARWRPWRPRSRSTATTSATRWRCCAGSAGARSPPWRARSWRPASSACR